MEFEFKKIKVRCFNLDGDIWFFGNDVATVLGYADKDKAVRDHSFESDRKSLKIRDSAVLAESELSTLWTNEYDKKPKTLINESALYCMIFGSKLEAAEEFKLWVTREILPSVRKNGGYIMDQETLTAEQQEKLVKKISKLSADVKNMKAKNAKLQARRHELIAELKTTKAKSQKRKKEIKALNEYASTLEDINSRIQQDYMIANSKLKAIKRHFNPIPITSAPSPTTSARKIVVDNQGFVRCIQ